MVQVIDLRVLHRRFLFFRYDAEGNELKAPPAGHGGPHGGHGGPHGERPKIYDKDGNEVTGRPEEGVTYYDKDGNELAAPAEKK